MDEPRTHYQISLTARQAVGLFVGLLAALGLAYFFGLMSGLSGGRAAPEAESVAAPGRAEPTPDPFDLAESVPLIETAVPTAVVSPGSRTELAGGFRETTPLPGEPRTLRPFEDGTADETSPVAEASGGKPAPSRPGDAAPAGRFWVQVASLSSRREAVALSRRLSRRGYRSQVQTAAAPAGKGPVFRVRVGPFGSEADAQRSAEKLREQEKMRGPWVVPDGK